MIFVKRESVYDCLTLPKPVEPVSLFIVWCSQSDTKRYREADSGAEGDILDEGPITQVSYQGFLQSSQRLPSPEHHDELGNDNDEMTENEASGVMDSHGHGSNGRRKPTIAARLVRRVWVLVMRSLLC